MKYFKIIMTIFIGAILMASNAMGQDANASISVLTLNGGTVAVNDVVDIQIDINNTKAGTIAVSKVRPNTTVPSSVTFLATADQTGLPTGWTIVSNTGSQLRVCNTGATIAGNSSTRIILKVRGVSVQASTPLSGAIAFGNGTDCTSSGAAPSGDIPADNNSNSSITVTAAVPCTIAAAGTAGTAIGCFGGTTSITASATGISSGSAEYALIDVNGATTTAFQASTSFTGLAAGTYNVIAREASRTTCKDTSENIVISQPTAVTGSASVTTPIATIGGTGDITVTATGGTGTKTYAITSPASSNITGATSGVFTGLLAGTYTFTITDANSCTGTATATINDPAPCVITGVTAAADSAISCFGGTTQITALAAGGTTYEYRLNSGAYQVSGVFTNIAAGTYTVTAREANNQGCTATSVNVEVTAPAVLAASAAVSTPVAIPGGQGTITVTATGGTTAYGYVITSGTTTNTTGATSGVFTGLLAGTYIFTVTDANGCTTTATRILADAGVAQADPGVGQMYFTTTAGASQDANNLLLAPSTAVYDINVPFYNLNQTNAIPNQTIEFRVNLGRKLILNPSFNLGTAPLSNYFSWSSTSENGDIIIVGTQTAAIPADFDGIATFRVKGDSACRSNVVSNIVITNLAQQLNDDDTNNNTATLQYNLPITLTRTFANVTCNGANNGTISVVASSGTRVIVSGPNSYRDTTLLPSGSNNFTKTGLAPGAYTITAWANSVSPLDSCSISTTATITEPTAVVLSTPSVVNIACFGSSDASISVVASGGTSPYSYVISGPTVNTSGLSSGTFTGLAAGTYSITVTDANLCTATSSNIVITTPSSTPDITLGSDVTLTAFSAPGVTQTIVYNIAEIDSAASVGDTIRITKVNGYTINFSNTQTQATVGSTTYNLDNSRWKIDNSNAAFLSIILTDPLNSNNAGTLLCSERVNVAISITRNTPDISVFTLSARLRKSDGEVDLNNNLNSIIFSAE
jgi:hypothetical protein